MAEGGQGTYIEQKFKQSDTNGDGKLSLDEFKAAFPWIDAGKTFATADTNKDGFLSSAELKAAQGKKHARPA
jgi:Ca2+-binding EF-hand superfamily protein